jgi:hypothetical protein
MSITNAGSGRERLVPSLCPEPDISERQWVQGPGITVYGQWSLDRKISGSGLPVPGYKLEPAEPGPYMNEHPDRSGNGPCITRNADVNVPPSPPDINVYHGHVIKRHPDGSARVRVDIPGYPNEVNIPEDCLPPGGGPVGRCPCI